MLLLKSGRRGIYSGTKVTNGVARVTPIPIITIPTIVVPTVIPMIMTIFYLSQIMTTFIARNFCKMFVTMIAGNLC